MLHVCRKQSVLRRLVQGHTWLCGGVRSLVQPSGIFAEVSREALPRGVHSTGCQLYSARSWTPFMDPESGGPRLLPGGGGVLCWAPQGVGVGWAFLFPSILLCFGMNSFTKFKLLLLGPLPYFPCCLGPGIKTGVEETLQRAEPWGDRCLGNTSQAK
jgi:hypothetical protein